jgi:hypothetical protein
MSRYGDPDVELENQGRKLKSLPGCARCGRRDLPVAIPVIIAGKERTWCLDCVLDDSKKARKAEQDWRGHEATRLQAEPKTIPHPGEMPGQPRFEKQDS